VERRSALFALLAGARAALSPIEARASLLAGDAAGTADAGSVLTVTGPVPADALGPTLVHEHVLVDFVGAAEVSRSRYDADEVFRTVLPRLEELRERGCLTFFDATPAYIGRDPLLLRRLAGASGLRIVTNTGYYGAASDKFVPEHAWRESATELAARWTTEFRDGIEGTGIRPGFLKLGVDAGSLSAIDHKIVEAGARSHLATGLTIAIHTGDGQAAREIVEVLEAHGVSPEAYVWVHAQNEKDPERRAELARLGVFVELDGVDGPTLEAHADGVVDLAGRGLLDRALVSHDAGWYHVGEPGGGTYRPHTLVFDALVPALRGRGMSEDDVATLLERNPGRAFGIRVRALRPAGGR